MSEFFIKPKAGVRVLDNVTKKPLAANGEAKPRNSYWLRRVREQSVDVVNPESVDEKASTKSKRRNAE